MITRLIVLLISSYLIISCQRNNKVTQSLNTIEINPTDSSRIGFSKYFSLEKYIILESSSSSVINEIRKITIIGDKIFILTWGKSQVVIFDSNGKYINQFNKYGRGPNEYLSIVDMFVSHNGDTIGLYDKFLKKILYYNSQGDHLKTVDLNVELESFTILQNGNIMGYSYLNHVPKLNDTFYQLWHFTPEGKIIEGFFPINNGCLGNSIGLASTFNITSSGLYFVPFTESSLYKITEDTLKIVPLYKFDFKDKTMPIDVLQMPRKEMNESLRNSFILSGEFIGRKNLLLNIHLSNRRDNFLSIYNLQRQENILINCKSLWDEANEIPLNTRMQNTFYDQNLYVAMVDPLRLQDNKFSNTQSLGYMLKEKTKITDNPVLLFYKEK